MGTDRNDLNYTGKEDLVIQLGEDKQQVGIILHNRPYSTSSNAWDRDTITATIVVNTVEFQGKVPTLIWSYELEELCRLLLALSQRVGHEEHVQFELREQTLNLVFELTRLGHIEVRVQVSDMDAEYPTILTFFILADQTYLAKWVSNIRKILEYFPRDEL
jgi:hypothetical protein